jgi:hypothetical protein
MTDICQGVDIPSWIQAASAVITVLVTVAVAWYAKRSADTADKALNSAIEAVNEARKAGKAAQDSAAAAQESTRISSIHFKREWEPHVEVLDVNHSGVGIFKVTVLNLGMKDAMLRSVLIKRENEGPDKALEQPLHVIAPSGKTIIVSLAAALNVYSQRNMLGSVQQLQTVVFISMSFDASGSEPTTTDWKRYRVRFAVGSFNSVEEFPEE